MLTSLLISTAQSRSPQLMDFSLTLETTTQLLLTFDSPVSAETCLSSGISLQNSPTSPTVKFDVSIMSCATFSTNIITVFIAEQEWSLIQSIETQSCTSVFIAIAISAGFIRGQTGIPCLRDSIYKGSARRPSGPPPTLMETKTNPETGQLDLKFSTAVNILSINVRGIICRFINSQGQLLTYTLTGGTVSYFGATTDVRIQLSDKDFDVIRRAGIRNAYGFEIMFLENSISSTGGVSTSTITEVTLDVANDTMAPTIRSFELDLNVGSITIWISEIIEINGTAGIDYSHIFITNSFTNLTQSDYNLGGTRIVSQTFLVETKIVLSFQIEFFNKLKGDANLCTSAANCFLFWESGSFRDVTNTETIMPNASIPASWVAPDLTPPILVSFSIDLEIGLLNLTFNEPVDVSTLVISSLTFISTTTDQYKAVNGSISENIFGFKTLTTITLSYRLWNFAKLLGIPYLIIESSAVTDTGGNLVAPINISHALSPSKLVNDSTPPDLLSFVAMETGEILLMFDEFVSTSSWNETLLTITLEISAGDFEYTGFSGGTLISGDILDQAVYTFSDDVIYNSTFFPRYVEAVTSGSVIITVEDGLILDVSGNQLGTVGTMKYTILPLDTTPPVLTAFNLNINTGIVQLIFSEAVYHVQGQQVIWIQNSLNDRRRLTVSNVMYYSDRSGPNPVFAFNLDTSTLHVIKTNRHLCTIPADCFIAVQSGSFMDREGNRIVNSGGVRVMTYIQDNIPPSITEFEVNLTEEKIVLRCSEPILISSLNFSKLYLSNSSQSESGINITGSVVTESTLYNTVITISINHHVLNIIKLDYSLCTSNANCYLRHSVGSYHDNSGNDAFERVVGQAHVFTSDHKRPVLLYYTLNLNLGTLQLSFSEPIFVFINERGYIENRMSSSTQSFLISGNVSETPSDNVTVHLENVNDLKFSIRLASRMNIFLYLTEMFARDIEDNMFFQDRSESQNYELIVDTSSPFLRFFTVNIDDGIITLQFSELVALTFLDTARIHLGSSDESGYNLSNSRIAQEGFTGTVNILLSQRLLNSVKSDSQVCTSSENCVIFLSSTAVQDISGNLLLSPPNGTFVQSFVPDTTGPTLMEYVIDLNSGIVVLTFDEPVIVSTFRISSLTLASNIEQQSISGTLLEGDIQTVLTLFLTTSSLNFAKLLCIPHLSIHYGAVTDTANNTLVQAVTNTTSTVFPDVTSPQLVHVNFSATQIAWTFTEYVNLSSWSSSLVSVTLEVSVGNIQYAAFTQETLTSSSAEQIIYVFNDTNDSFYVHYTEAFSNGTIILTVQEGFISDVSGNPYNTTESFIYTMQPPDVTAPTLLTFDLDMNTGTLQLTFSEPVYIVEVPGKVRFVNSRDSNSVTNAYTLMQNVTFPLNTTGPIPMWEISLGMRDINALKANRDLCTDDANTFAMVFAYLAKDRHDNPSKQNSNGIQVRMFTPDDTNPLLEYFKLDLDQGVIDVSFSEPILRSSIVPSLFGLGNSAYSSNTINLTSSPTAEFEQLDTMVTIILHNIPLNRVKNELSLCTTRSNCYLSYHNGSFADTADNNATEANGIQSTSVIPDNTGPELLQFSIDLNATSTMLVLTFDEPIEEETFNPAGLKLLTEQSSHIYLSSAFIVQTDAEKTIIHLRLGSSLSNEVKRLNTFNPGNLTLSVTSSAAEDLYSNPVTPVPINSPIPVSEFVPDSTPPRLLQFIPGTPNLTDITLMFSEYVNGSSLNEDHMNISLTTRQGSFLFSAFSGGMITSDLITDRIVYSLSEEDQHRLTESDVLSAAISSGSLELQIGHEFVTDLNNNALIPDPTPLRFTTDSTRPVLLNYTLDLDGGLLELGFSEPVFLSPPAVMGRFQSSPDPEEVITFFQHEISSLASETQTISISAILDHLLLDENIGSSPNNTYLTMQEEFARDLSGHFVQPSLNLQAYNVIADTSRPRLMAFTADMNTSEMTLHFSETVRTLSLDTSLLYLTMSRYNLTGSIATGENFTTTLTMNLHEYLLNAIKSDPLICSNKTNCVMFVRSAAVQDIVGNGITPSNAGIIASTFIPDSTSPELREYTIDLDHGSMIIDMTEPVNVSSLRLSQLILVGSDVNQHQPLNGTILEADPILKTSIELSLDTISLNHAKSLLVPNLAILGGAIEDAAGNPILPVDVVSPSNIVPDSTPPTLINFTPAGARAIGLFYDEAVRTDDWNGNLVSMLLEISAGNIEYTLAKEHLKLVC